MVFAMFVSVTFLFFISFPSPLASASQYIPIGNVIGHWLRLAGSSWYSWAYSQKNESRLNSVESRNLDQIPEWLISRQEVPGT